MKEARFVSDSLAETLSLGKKIGSELLPGDTVVLRGEMGAGKSEICRGIARALGITCPIPSPTFTIVNVYETACCQLYHYDFYRLNGLDELYEAGLDEWIGGDGIALIEWPERVEEVVPEKCLEITITMTPDKPDRRSFLLRVFGSIHPFSFLTDDKEQS